MMITDRFQIGSGALSLFSSKPRFVQTFRTYSAFGRKGPKLGPFTSGHRVDKNLSTEHFRNLQLLAIVNRRKRTLENGLRVGIDFTSKMS